MNTHSDTIASQCGGVIWHTHSNQSVQGRFREHSGKIQGRFREDSGNIQHSGNIQGTFREHSGNNSENAPMNTHSDTIASQCGGDIWER
jgi:hypothetical protein